MLTQDKYSAEEMIYVLESAQGYTDHACIGKVLHYLKDRCDVLELEVKELNKKLEKKYE